MSNDKWKVILKSPTACKVMAFLIAGICIYGIAFNLYYALGGECHSMKELISCITKDDVVILIIGIVFFTYFMWASQKEEPESPEGMIDILKNSESMDDMEKETGHTVSRRQKCTLRFCGEQVTFYVPANCSLVETDSEGETEENGFASAIFYTKDEDAVNIYLLLAEDEFAGGAKGYIEDSFLELPQKVQKNVRVKRMSVGKNLCYYFEACYKEDGSRWQEIYMACDVGRNGIFAVELDSVDNKRNLSINDIQEIFDNV